MSHLRPWTEALVALMVSTALAVALTWPTALHLGDVVVGGGELGGWMWRQWWHFQEAHAIAASDMGPLERLRTLIALGRYPETGNILDVLLLSYPLDDLFGFPYHHNLKVLIILIGNGLSAYVLARSLTESRVVALAAATVGIVNPLVIQDVNKTGLRQVLLWWLLLYPVALGRAERSRRPLDGALAGLVFAMVSAFYWFYGLFAALFTLIRLIAQLRAVWRAPRQAARWLLPFAAAATIGALFFLLPYFSAGQESGGQGGVTQLPELSFFLPFPAYDTIASAPLRPQTYRDNVLSSLHRTIDSAWAADYVFNPRHGVLALPVVVFVMGVLPALFVRRARVWLVVWVFFWAGTLGPFLKLGAQKDTADVLMLGERVVRLPFVYLFQFVPGMSRMFAPYRMGSMVVVASVALLALTLGSLSSRKRVVLSVIAGLFVVAQPFYRFDLGPVARGTARPAMWRVPVQVSAFRLPSWYEQVDPQGWEGLIELPLDQQQDLICAYQTFHHRKVYRSWATSPAIPPAFRKVGGGPAGKRLRWLASADPRDDGLLDLFRAISTDPLNSDLANKLNGLPPTELLSLMDAGSYRWLVIHERGFYLMNPEDGGTLYRFVVRQLAAWLGQEADETIDQAAFEWPGKHGSFPVGGAWVPWASQEVQLPAERMPNSYGMAVFDLDEWRGRAGSDRPAPDLPAPPGASQDEPQMHHDGAAP